MKLFKNAKNLLVIIAILFLAVITFSSVTKAQDRPRIVKIKKQKKAKTPRQFPVSPKAKSKPKKKSRPKTKSRPKAKIISKPKVLTNTLIVRKKESPRSLVRRTSKVKARRKTSLDRNANRRLGTRHLYSATTQSMMLSSIKRKIGVRYRMGTHGPSRYDCSGFVWKVFQESQIPFRRTSARWLWKQFEPVYGEDRYKFGTLVFFNRLGHVGIVADKEGFYHASSSKGVTYSKFKGYWSKRIVGYRRVARPVEFLK